MQKATRSIFTQKGSEVQKINQSGIWAYVESSYPNPDFDSACEGYEVSDGEGRIISVAKWIYRCKRLLRKNNHIAVSIDNGEVLEPCYLIEPSSDNRLQDKTLVWLEPLPQLNGYVIIPGGTSQCGEGYGSGLLDCDSLLNCLCVTKTSYGNVTGLFIKKYDGRLEEVEDCNYYVLGGCWWVIQYVADFQFEINGEQYSGTLMSYPRDDMHYFFFTALESPSLGRLSVYIRGRHHENGFSGFSIYLYSYSSDFFCTLGLEDFDILAVNCPGSPRRYVTILPGRCISGTIRIRPYGIVTGGGYAYSPCCPIDRPSHYRTPYKIQYDLTINATGERISGYTARGLWGYLQQDNLIFTGHFSESVILSVGSCERLLVEFDVYCKDNMLFAAVTIRCLLFLWNRFYTMMHLQPGYEDWDYSVEGCPSNPPTFYFTARPGRDLSGWFKLMPVDPNDPN